MGRGDTHTQHNLTHTHERTRDQFPGQLAGGVLLHHCPAFQLGREALRHGQKGQEKLALEGMPDVFVGEQ